MEALTGLPAGATDRTPPNFGLTQVFTTDHGAAYRCLACHAGTRNGAYTLEKTRVAATIHREDSCPFPVAHHVTKTVPDAYNCGERYRAKSNGSCGRWVRTDDSVAQCICGWTALEDTRAEARRSARAHRDAAHRAWLANHNPTA